MIVHLHRDADGVVRHVTTMSRDDETAAVPRLSDPEAPNLEVLRARAPDGRPAGVVRARQVLEAIEPTGPARWKGDAHPGLRALRLEAWAPPPPAPPPPPPEETP